MTIEQALVTRLAEVLGHDRVYPDAVPLAQNTWPCVVYMHTGDDEQFGLNGGAPGDHVDMFTLDVWGPDRAALATARDLLKAQHAGVNCQGVWGGSGGVVVAGAYCKDATADISPADDSSDRHHRCERLSLKVIWYANP